MQNLPIQMLAPAERNPNEMDEAKLDALSQLIEKYGFLQPILATPNHNGTWTIVDGHHRSIAARRAGLTEVSAIVKDHFAPQEIEALRVGMNVLRGDLNYTIAAEIATELRDEWGWDQDAIGTSFGFSDEELDELFDLAQQTAGQVEDDLGAGESRSGGEVPPDVDDEEKAPKAFELRIEYDSRKDYMRVRRALRKHGGKNATLAECMDALIAATKGK